MTVDRISAMVATGESDTLEFKTTTGARREAAATVCALLNERGGHVLFGVTPEGLFAPHESLPWNPLIARTFYRRGLIWRT